MWSDALFEASSVNSLGCDPVPLGIPSLEESQPATFEALADHFSLTRQWC